MPILENANDILIDLNGEVAYLTDEDLFVRDLTSTDIVAAQIISGNSDLGSPDIDKLINFVDIDYVGAFELRFYLDGTLIHTMVFNNVTNRTILWRDYPLNKRIAFKKLRIVLVATNFNTKIYGIEIDFSVLRRRRYN